MKRIKTTSEAEGKGKRLSNAENKSLLAVAFRMTVAARQAAAVCPDACQPACSVLEQPAKPLSGSNT